MRPAVLALALLGAIAAPALAHEGNPNFESQVTSVEGVPGLVAQVLNGDDRLLLVHRGEGTVVVEGYDGEPYLRLRPGGAVEVNRRSEAAYLNDDRFGDVAVPPVADNDADPQWRRAGGNGRAEFHDHRIHWMAKGDPPQVRDRARRQKVLDWTVPVRVEGGRAGAVRGTLWWRGEDEGAVSAGTFVGIGIFALAALAFVVAVRRRRGRAGAPERPAREEVW